MAMKPQRLRMTAASATLAAGFGLLAAACGSTASPPAAGGSTASPPAGGQAATNPASKATLEVVESVPGGQPRHWTLRCDPAGGSMPDAAAACQLIATDATILHPMRATGIMCPMILANARTFTITGTWHGTMVRQIIHDGGCDLRRWNRLVQIFN
jgi:hypothetical protein